MVQNDRTAGPVGEAAAIDTLAVGAPRPPLCPAPARRGSAAAHVRESLGSAPASRESAPETLARMLGWIGVASGFAGVVAGGRIARGLGMRGCGGPVRLCAAREIGSGAALLLKDRPADRARWARRRAIGGAVDLAALSTGLCKSNPKRNRVLGAMGVVGAMLVVDALAATLLSER